MTVIDFDKDFNLDDLVDKWVIAYREAPTFELSGIITEVEPAVPTILSEGWIVTIDNREFQYNVRITTNHWTVETAANYVA